MPVRQGVWAALLTTLVAAAAWAEEPMSPSAAGESEKPSGEQVARTANKPAATAQPADPHDWLTDHPTIQRLLELHNQTRARAGLPPLTLNTQMCLAAQRHANWMASYGSFAHSGLPFRENIAYSQRTPEHAVQTWTYSPGHYSNMCSGRECGFGFQNRGGVGYWVALFR